MMTFDESRSIKKQLFVPRFRSWENAGVGMVDVKVAILYIHGAGHV